MFALVSRNNFIQILNKKLSILNITYLTSFKPFNTKEYYIKKSIYPGTSNANL